MPEISIIVPVYNVEKYLPQCLDSLLAQTFGDIEVIAVDDGSTDSSGGICDVYAKADGRVKVIHRKNGGLSAARNTGMEHAAGNWVIFVDSDDWAEPDMCESAHNVALQTGAELVFWASFSNFPEKEEKPIATDGRIHILKGEQINDLQKMIVDNGTADIGAFRNVSRAWCKMWKRCILFGEGRELFFDENLKWGEDQLFNLKALNHVCSAAYISRPLFHYRIREGSIATAFRPNRLNELNYFLEALNGYILAYKENEQSFKEAYSRRVVYVLRVAVRTHFCNEQCGKDLRERAASLKRFADSEPYSSALKAVDLSSLAFKRRVFVAMVRRRFYTLVLLLFGKRSSLPYRKSVLRRVLALRKRG